MINYGWWWHERAGLFRRIRGQGLEPKKRFDHLEFLDNPDNRRDHPWLFRWITKRKRDQEWGNRWFPFFPDILFYLKFYFLLPLGFYLVGSKIVQRKRVHRAYKRKLVRDHELEETYYKSSKLNDMIDYGWSEFVYIFQSFWSMFGDSDVSKYDDKSQLKTESYSDFIKGHAEYLKEKARNDKFFISPDRSIVGAGKSNVIISHFICMFRW